MSLTFRAGFWLLRFVQDVEACLHRIFPPKEFRNKSRVLEISDPVAVFSIIFYCLWCRFKILTSIANFDIRFVICMKNWPFSKKKVSHSEARFESYSTLKSVHGSSGHTLVSHPYILIESGFFIRKIGLCANSFWTEIDTNMRFFAKWSLNLQDCNVLVRIFIWRW